MKHDEPPQDLQLISLGEALHGLASGQWTRAQFTERHWSMSEQCVVGLVLNDEGQLPASYPTPGEAWGRLDAKQRDLVRCHALLAASVAARAAAARGLPEGAWD